MCEQIKEKLYYKGKQYDMGRTRDCYPLNQYLEKRNDVKFVWQSTSCYNGYIATWAIENNKLLLIELKGYIDGRKEVNLNYVFPNQTKVFANWFTGEIKIPIGVVFGRMDISAKDLFLKFENGIFVSEKEIDNRNSDEYKLYSKIQLKTPYEIFAEKNKGERINNNGEPTYNLPF